MNRTLLYIVLLSAALLSGCGREDMPSAEISGQRIWWNVDSVEGLRATKSLINSYDALVDACKPEGDGGD